LWSLGKICYILLNNIHLRNFNGFTELGLTAAVVGGTPDQIMYLSENLYHYISHLQVALSGFIIAIGIAVIALALFGIRPGKGWALWIAFVAPVVAVVIALPLHYPYHFATLGHLGLIYLDAVILLIETILSYRAMKA
jgi:hypothetical protein